MSAYHKLTWKAVLELVAPHTWSASLVPVFLGAILSIAFENSFSPLIFFSLLAVAVLLQSAVNSINDYADFVKGTDSEENCDDPTDASIVFNKINPRQALYIGLAAIIGAGLFGIYIVYQAGIVPLLFGGFGVLVIAFYSGGKIPISYLPLGELVSGFVMGGLITLVSYYSFTQNLNLKILYYALVPVLTTGLIMLTNNTADIEKDRQAGRKTLPVLIGRKHAARTLKTGVVLALVLVSYLILSSFKKSLFLLPIMLIFLGCPTYSLFKNPIGPYKRREAMVLILNIHKGLNFFYLAAIVVNLILTES